MHQINHLNLGIKNLFEINDDVRGTCNSNTQIKFNMTTFKSSLCNYSDA